MRLVLWITRNALEKWRICLPKAQVPEWSSTGSLVCYSYVSMAAIGFAFVCACVRVCACVHVHVHVDIVCPESLPTAFIDFVWFSFPCTHVSYVTYLC